MRKYDDSHITLRETNSGWYYILSFSVNNAEILHAFTTQSFNTYQEALDNAFEVRERLGSPNIIISSIALNGTTSFNINHDIEIEI